MIPEPWMTGANCATTDGDAFFPNKGESSTAARKVCAACDVREACLQWALAKPVSEDWGVAGGTTEFQRKKLRKERA